MGSSARRTGQLIGNRYELIEQIGAGGMAEVWKVLDQLGPARDEAGALYYAIKFVNKSLMHQPPTRQQVVDRFVREIASSKRFRHEHIIRVLEAGTDSYGVPYYVMDLVDGLTLDRDIQTITNGRRPPILAGYALKDLYRFMDQLLSALGYLHREGVIHRDIKPHNLMITRPAQLPPSLMLLDLGIAKVGSSRPGGAGTSLTLDHQVVGTPSYMALEACGPVRDPRGKIWSVGPYTDLKGVGTVWYEGVTGHLPFPGSTLAERQLRLSNPDEPIPDPGHFVKDLNPRLREVIMKALSPFPWDRYQDAEKMREAFRWAEENELWIRQSRVTPVHGFSIFSPQTASVGAGIVLQPPRQVARPLPATHLFRHPSKRTIAISGAVVLSALVIAFRPHEGEHSKKHASQGTASIVPAAHAERNSVSVVPVPSVTPSPQTGISPDAVIELGDSMVKQGKRNCPNAIRVYRVALKQTSDPAIIERIQKKIADCRHPSAPKKAKRGHPQRSPRKR